MEKSSFFDSVNGDRRYKSEEFTEYFASFIGNGVFPNPSSNLQAISNNNMNVTIQPGKAWINGYFYVNTDNLVIPVDIADGVLNRKDRVVVRLDFINREMRVAIKKGTPASVATAPGLQRDKDIHELGIAVINVGKGIVSVRQHDIVDTRLNNAVCGITHGVVEQADTSAIFNQFQSWYSNKKSDYERDLNANKAAYDAEWRSWYETNTAGMEGSFISWFNSVKGLLDEDVAGNLTNKAIELEGRIDEINGSGVGAKASQEDLDKHVSSVASIEQAGHVKLYDGVNSASTVLAATAGAVKKAHDKASNHSHNDLYYTKSEIDNRKGVIAAGQNNFNRTTGTVVTIPTQASNLSYNVAITSVEDPKGYLGEIWVEKSRNNFIVKNSGSFKGLFNYIVI